MLKIHLVFFFLPAPSIVYLYMGSGFKGTNADNDSGVMSFILW